MNNRVSFLSGALGGLVLIGIMGIAWTQAGYEGAAGTKGTITNATAADQIDNFIRDTRQELRYRLEVEHFFGEGDGLVDDNGLHRLGSARCYMSDTAPTELSDSHTGIAATGLADYDNSTGAEISGEPDLDDSATNSAAGIEDDVGHGRCWVDLDGPDNDSATTIDNNKLYTFIGEAGAGNGAWVAVDASARPGGDDEILAGAYNLIYNGSFEATDGTGDLTSAVVPSGWVDGGVVCTHAYNNPTTDDDYGEGYEYECSGAGGANAFIQQTLTSLPNNQFYKVVARSRDDNTTVCTLDVTGEGGALFTAVSTTNTGDWETLEGTFGTGGGFNTVVVTLTRVDDTQVCLWDHVAVYRIDDVEVDRPEVSEPGIYRVRGEYAVGSGNITCGAGWDAGACADANTGLIVAVTLPNQHIITIDASASVNATSGVGTDCWIRLYDKSNAAYLDTGFYVIHDDGLELVRFHATVIDQDPGDTIEYALQVREDAPAAGDCNIDSTFTSWIEAVVTPVR